MGWGQSQPTIPWRPVLAFAGLSLILGIAGCATRQFDVPASQAPQAPILLTPEKLVGHTLSLISRKRIEDYDFDANGVVLPVFSAKTAPFGSTILSVCPIYDWKIVDGHKLVMTAAPEGEPASQISHVFVTFTETLAVTTDGKKFEVKNDLLKSRPKD